MAKNHNLSVSVLRQLFSHVPETGELFWKHRDVSLFKDSSGVRKRTAAHTAKIWNTKWSGRPAITSRDKDGYKHGAALGANLVAHRVIFALHYSVEMKDLAEIDHINGNPSDNRIVNLRHVSHTENTQNAALYKNNKTGYHGVFWDTSHKAWCARIGKKRIGRFQSFEKAVAARKKAEIEYGFHHNHGRIAQLP